ncbi:MAG: PilW family protein [Pseudomonadota bacterium]
MPNSQQRQLGLSLVELLVSLAIGSFLIIGALTVYTQNRATYISNEQLARVQENAQFALDVIEPHIRLSSYWGQTSRWNDVDGAKTDLDNNPNNLTIPADNCDPGWPWDLEQAIAAENNTYNLGCAPKHIAQTDSDVLITRHASVATAAPTAGRIQIRSSRTRAQLFSNGVEPNLGGGATELTYDLSVNAFYVAERSDLFPDYPSLRRKVLREVGGAPVIVDEEVAPGVENMQVQFGLDTDGDNSVDRYVDPDSVLMDPADPAFILGTRVLTARLWLLVRAQAFETGVTDNRIYDFADVNLGAFNDRFRRLLVSKTVLLHNTRL